MPEIRFDEIDRLARSEAPDLADAILAFLDQDDPEPKTTPPEGSLQFDALLQLLRNATSEWADETERRTKVNEAWHRFLTQTDPPLPPRFALADLVVRLYQGGTDSGRAAVLRLAMEAPLRFGLWAGLKRVFKLAEDRLDAEMFGALAWRFDTSYVNTRRAEISKGTLLYLRRRAWRFLRELGRNVPALYVQFAVQTLRRYGESPSLGQTWIPGHVIAHELRRYGATFHGWGLNSLGDDIIGKRAFDEAWKASPGPLMFLLETCEAELPAKFAIQSLRRDFPKVLREVPPAWLGRLALRRLEAVHDFIVEVFHDSPEFAQAKLRSLGLHETVLELLKSPSEKARTYAIEYARAQAPDMPPRQLVDLLADSDVDDEVKAFALQMLQQRKPKEIGCQLLGRLLDEDDVGEDCAQWAAKALNEGFDRAEVPESFLIEMIFGTSEQTDWVRSFFEEKYQKGELGAAFWKKALTDKAAEDEDCEFPLEMLEEYPIAEIGVSWILDHLENDDWGENVAEWLEKAEKLTAAEVERIKGLVFHKDHRPVALRVLANPKAAKATDIGLPWLLALARREDPELHEFARKYLLQHMKPGDFNSGDAGKGVQRLFDLAVGKEPEPIRAFAQAYLRCHHPVAGPEQEESKALDLKPLVPREAYSLERVWPALLDARPDVRKFAVVIARADLRRWGAQGRVYELAESEGKEVRNLAYEALLRAGDPTADEARTLTPEEIDPAKVFEMAESRLRSTREVAMELIRKHYQRLGSPERLGWLMQSADRTVRTMAVRLLWERHRPRSFPRDWKPRPPRGGSRGGSGSGFHSELSEEKKPAAQATPAEAPAEPTETDPLEKTIDELGLAEDTTSVLEDMGIDTVGELMDLTASDLIDEGVTRKGIRELVEVLKKMNLSLEGVDELPDEEGEEEGEDGGDSGEEGEGDDEPEDDEGSEDGDGDEENSDEPDEEDDDDPQDEEPEEDEEPDDEEPDEEDEVPEDDESDEPDETEDGEEGEEEEPEDEDAEEEEQAQRPSAAFLKNLKADAALSKVVGSEPMTRVEVIKRIWEYVHKRGLQDKVERRMINADDILRDIFGGQAQVSMFDMVQLVNKHLVEVGAEEEHPEAEASPDDFLAELSVLDGVAEQVHHELSELDPDGDPRGFIGALGRLREVKDQRARDRLVAEFVYNRHNSWLAGGKYDLCKQLLKGYLALVPEIGHPRGLVTGSRTGTTFRLREAIASDAVALMARTGDTELWPTVRKLLPEQIKLGTLAYNLACFFAVQKDKARMLEYVEQAVALGKLKPQFLDDSDFAAFKEDDDFLDLLGSDEDQEESGEPEGEGEDEEEPEGDDETGEDEEEPEGDDEPDEGDEETAGDDEAEEAAPKPPTDRPSLPGYAGPFKDVHALRAFLRSILFGLPPGRAMDSRDDRQARLRIPAGEAKRNVVEVVRDLAIEDHDFAQLVLPVLDEFTASLARGEWQACLSAVVAIKAQHPDLDPEKGKA